MLPDEVLPLFQQRERMATRNIPTARTVASEDQTQRTVEVTKEMTV